jgi:hypothetical protein
MNCSIISIRESVLRAVVELGADLPSGHREAILCRDGYIVGHQFNFDGVRAVWFVDDCEIKIKNGQGDVLRILDLNAQPDARAA